jgi:hypothetical protein
MGIKKQAEACTLTLLEYRLQPASVSFYDFEILLDGGTTGRRDGSAQAEPGTKRASWNGICVRKGTPEAAL